MGYAHLVFMPLAFGLAQELKDGGDEIAHIYEYLDKAGQRSINGMPIFWSCHLMTKKEFKALDVHLNKLREFEKRFMGEVMDLDKKKGCFYGLAVGDALGAAVEFKEPGTFEPVVNYRGFGPHGLAPGQWTDDTSLALALADSLAKGWDTRDQLQNYLDWMKDGKYSVTGYLFDIGTTTRYALNQFERDESLENNPDIADSGNGSIMRLAPIPIVYGDGPIDELCEKARESSKTTHSSPLCQDCCVYLAVVLAALMKGEGKEVLSRSWWDAKGIQLHKRVDEIIDNPDHHVKGSGFVVDSLHAALQSFQTGESFEDAVLKAVNLGDDADTTGAVCGQLAGAYWGFSGIPKQWIDELAEKEMIDLYLNPILGE